MRKLTICLAALGALLVAGTRSFGAGGIWVSKSGDVFSFSKATPAAADAYLIPTGIGTLFPGNEGASLPAYRPGVCWLWQRYDAYRIVGTPFESWPAGVLRFRADSTGIGVTGKALVSDSLRVPYFSTANVINVRTWGARGDGVTDDTTPVTNAINAAPDKGIVYFPQGTYKLTTWSVLTPGKVLTFLGDGQQRSILTATTGKVFVSVTKDFRVRGLTFDTWNYPFDLSPLTTAINYASFDDYEVTNSVRGIYGSNTNAGAGVRDFSVRNSRITNMTSYGIYLNLPVVEDASVENTHIKGTIERGIQFGNNTVAYSADRGRYVVRNCVVDSVTGTGSQSAEGILLYGWRAVVDGNFVRAVYKSDNPTGTDAEGIYTKCRFSRITNNILVDAGQSEGMINIKGTARGETPTTSPWGYAVLVEGNFIYDTGTGRKSYGIKAAVSEVVIRNNYVEGVAASAIYTDSDSSSVYTISSNTIRALRGHSGIQVFGSGRRIAITDNTIDSVSASYDTTAQNSGILIQKNGGGDIDIIGNRIHYIQDRGTTPVGILIKPSGVLDNVRVMFNKVDGAYYGTQFSNTACDSVNLIYNAYRGIISTDEKLSTTPTHFTQLLPTQPVVSYESADKAAIYNGTNLQELRVYGTRTDASNYERMTMKTGTTSMTLASEAAGTGTARALQFSVGGTNYWRVETNGNFTPLLDVTYDVGNSGANTVRAVYSGKVVSDSTRADQGLFVGGQRLTKYLQASATLDFDLTAVVSQDLTVTVSGAALGDQVAIGVPNGSVTADTVFWGWVSATDTVTIRASRIAGTPNPASGSFKVSVFK